MTKSCRGSTFNSIVIFRTCKRTNWEELEKALDWKWIENFNVALSRKFGVNDEQALGDIKKMILIYVKMKQDRDL